jgi:hypothetical protein
MRRCISDMGTNACYVELAEKVKLQNGKKADSEQVILLNWNITFIVVKKKCVIMKKTMY